MASIYDMLAEQRIADAQRRGDFDHLPGAGKPLMLDDEALVPPEQRMANTILRNAGFCPPEIGLRKEIARLRSEIAGLAEGARRTALRRRLALLILQMAETKR